MTTRCLHGLAPKMDRRLTRVTDAQCFTFHDAAESTWEVRCDVLVVRLSGGGSLCSSLVVLAMISSESCDNRQRKCVWSGEQQLDMEVSGVQAFLCHV